jgi:DNA ligase-1
MIKKPMLAASMENSRGDKMSLCDLKYPLIASVKLDGIRCLRLGGKSLSRSFKEIPNLFIQEKMSSLPDGLDGELITLEKDGSIKDFSKIQSDVMSENGEPNFVFQIFDFVSSDLEKPYVDRIKDLEQWAANKPDYCEIVDSMLVANEKELQEFENKSIQDGHEGVMIRSLNGPYKCGRSSFKEQFLVKIKRFVDSEAEIMGLEERLHNYNEATLDELGHTKRSSAKSGLVPANTLGTILVRDIHDGREFGIGTGRGLDDALRKTIWENKNLYLGKIIRYRYQEVGTKDLPRIPSFQGFRHKDDMS